MGNYVTILSVLILRCCFGTFLQVKVKDKGSFHGPTSKEEHVSAQLFEALCYKPQGRGYDYRWRHLDFHYHNTSGRTTLLVSTQPPKGMGTSGQTRPLLMADNFTTFMC
jgi:hypothetical protein